MKVSTAVLSLITIALSTQFPVIAAPQQGSQTQSTVSQQEILFSQAELDQMLAPIALYPDTVLSHVLIAATYPLEIVKATRWLSTQPGMTSEQALKAAENEPWDPSVRALVAFPPLLTKLNNELEWTQKLGDAFLSQEADVMATVQRLREKAYAAGNLQNQEHIVVERKEKVIIIEPREREVVYVPVYDTRVVYGDWWWDRYPPVHWPYPTGHGTYVYWGVGARVSPGFYFSTFYWPERQLVVIHDYRPTRYYRAHEIYRHEQRRHWSHNPYHRHGVVYPRSYQPVVETRGPDHRYGGREERRYDNEQDRRRWSAEKRLENQVGTSVDREIVRETRGTDQSLDARRQQRLENREENPTREIRGSEHRKVDRDLAGLRDASGQDRRNDRAEERLPTYTQPVSTTPRNDLPAELEPLRQPAIDRSSGRVNTEVVRDIREERGNAIGRGDRIQVDRQRDTRIDTLPTQTIEQPRMEDRRPQRLEPRVERQEPRIEMQQPRIERQEPRIEMQQPRIERQEPRIEMQQPRIERQEPVFTRPEPVMQRQEPRIERQEPVFNRPEPVMQRQEPRIEMPQPRIERQEPRFERPEPRFERPEPVFNRPEPMQTMPVIESRGRIE